MANLNTNGEPAGNANEPAGGSAQDYLMDAVPSRRYHRARAHQASYPQPGTWAFPGSTFTRTLAYMPFEMPEQGRRLARRQHDVISRAQGPLSGLSGNAMDGRLRTGHWRRVHRGVYTVVTGHLTREAQLRAALLRAGEGAVLSYYTAAELHGLTDHPSELIHITVPEGRNPARRKKIQGVIIHRSRLIL